MSDSRMEQDSGRNQWVERILLFCAVALLGLNLFELPKNQSITDDFDDGQGIMINKICVKKASGTVNSIAYATAEQYQKIFTTWAKNWPDTGRGRAFNLNQDAMMAVTYQLADTSTKQAGVAVYYGATSTISATTKPRGLNPSNMKYLVFPVDSNGNKVKIDSIYTAQVTSKFKLPCPEYCY